MNTFAQAFPVPATLVGTLFRAKANLLHKAVGYDARRMPDQGNRAVFLKPTKGFRSIAKKRLGE